MLTLKPKNMVVWSHVWSYTNARNRACSLNV